MERSGLFARCQIPHEKILNDFFENELQEEMNRVFNDMNEDIEDSVDLELKRNFAKKIKYCEEGHRNNIQRKNRKYCNIGNCKSILKDNEQNDEVPDSIGEKDPALSASEYYMSLPNINSEKVEEVPIGAIPINPNNKERVQKCLDEILDKCNMTDNYSIKLSIEGTISEKIY